jgi:XTP/dITP diphosphohydrolase
MKNQPETIVLATSNENKFVEIRQILKNLPVNVLSLKDFPEIPFIPETGNTFMENAQIKAIAVFKKTGLLAVADDSGLEVDALNGEPGIFSSRFAGRERDYEANNKKLITLMKKIPSQSRGAQFRCVVAIIGRNIEEITEGIIRGKITIKPRGTKGFGYDPLFIPNGYKQTFAELGEKIKNQISHRAIAFKKTEKLIIISNN